MTQTRTSSGVVARTSGVYHGDKELSFKKVSQLVKCLAILCKDLDRLAQVDRLVTVLENDQAKAAATGASSGVLLELEKKRKIARKLEGKLITRCRKVCRGIGKLAIIDSIKNERLTTLLKKVANSVSKQKLLQPKTHPPLTHAATSFGSGHKALPDNDNALLKPLENNSLNILENVPAAQPLSKGLGSVAPISMAPIPRSTETSLSSQSKPFCPQSTKPKYGHGKPSKAPAPPVPSESTPVDHWKDKVDVSDVTGIHGFGSVKRLTEDQLKQVIRGRKKERGDWIERFPDMLSPRFR